MLSISHWLYFAIEDVYIQRATIIYHISKPKTHSQIYSNHHLIRH